MLADVGLDDNAGVLGVLKMAGLAANGVGGVAVGIVAVAVNAGDGVNGFEHAAPTQPVAVGDVIAVAGAIVGVGNAVGEGNDPQLAEITITPRSRPITLARPATRCPVMRILPLPMVHLPFRRYPPGSSGCWVSQLASLDHYHTHARTYRTGVLTLSAIFQPPSTRTRVKVARTRSLTSGAGVPARVDPGVAPQSRRVSPGPRPP